MEGLSQSFHMKIWKNVMERIHEGYEYKDFEMPSSIEKKTICAKPENLQAVKPAVPIRNILHRELLLLRVVLDT